MTNKKLVLTVLLSFITLVILTTATYFVFFYKENKTQNASSPDIQNISNDKKPAQFSILTADGENEVGILEKCDIAMKIPKKFQVIDEVTSGNGETKFVKSDTLMEIYSITRKTDYDYASFTDADLIDPTIAIIKAGDGSDGSPMMSMHATCLDSLPKYLMDVNTAKTYDFTRRSDFKNPFLDSSLFDELHFASHTTSGSRDAYIFKLKNSGKYLAIFSTFKLYQNESDFDPAKKVGVTAIGKIIIQPNSLAPSKTSIAVRP